MKHVRVTFAITVCFLTQLAAAQVLPSNNTTNFGMIGITRGQTLQLNLVAIPTDPCFAQLGFQNSAGSPVGPTLNVALQAGQSASLAVNGNSLTNVPGQRVEVLPTVVVTAGTASQCDASAEVFTWLRNTCSVASASSRLSCAYERSASAM